MTQGLVTSVLGVVLIRIAATGEYLRYVQPWMRWPLVGTGALLLLISIRQTVGVGRDADRVPRTTWLVLLPPMVVFLVAPPALGAYIAERRADQQPAPVSASEFRPSPGPDGVVETSVEQFVWGASGNGDLGNLRGTTFRVQGFVSSGDPDAWYVTQLILYCCAADVGVQRVKVIGQPAPPRDQWVRVTGTWVPGSGADGSRSPTMRASEVEQIPTPEDPYS